ncbi:MAG: PH domain-containing protein [Myxococcota bacterium]|nr:PH domain-containing protein [Myxococcota bacterium]
MRRFFASAAFCAYLSARMQRCPHCDTELSASGTTLPAICPSCGETLGEPPRRAAKDGGVADGAGPSSGAAIERHQERVLFEGRPATVSGLGDAMIAVLTLGLGWVWLWARARGTHYKVTTSRIVIEQGLFSKRLEQIDLYRVDDYIVELPFAQRLLGTGNLVIATSDRSAKGEVRLDRLRTDVRALYEELRTATERDKSRRGVRRFDSV